MKGDTSLRDLVIKLLVLLYDEDLHWLMHPTNDQIDRAEELALQLHAACYPDGEVARSIAGGEGVSGERPDHVAEAFLDGSMGIAHPDCERSTKMLARWSLSLSKSEAEWKRKAARRTQHIGDLLDKIGNLRYELREVEQMLAWVVRTEQPLDEIRRVIEARIPQRLAREPELGRDSLAPPEAEA